MPTFLAPVDLSLFELRNAVVQALGADPTGVEARLYWNSSTHQLKVYNGTTWQTIATSEGMTQEQIEDLVASLIDDSTDITWTYTDNGSGAGSLTAAVNNSAELGGEPGSYYLDRTNHTGTQTAATISDLAEAARDAVGAILTDTATADFTYDDAANSGAGTISLAVLDSPLLQGQNSAYHLSRANHSGTQAASTISDFTEATQDVIGALFVDSSTIDYTYNDAGDALTVAVLDSPLLQGQNSAYHLSRANHSGTQASTTISDFAEAAQDAVGGILVDSSTLDFTYTDATPSITAAVLDSPLLQGQNSAYHLSRSNHTGTQAASTISDFDTQVRTSRLDQMAAPTASVSLNSQKITNLADGTAATDAATFGQLNAILQGQQWKDAPADWTTTGNITLSGLATQGNGEWTGALTAGDRILVKDQTTTADNGIYVAAAGAWTRATDADAAAELNQATVLVLNGAAHKGDIFTQTATIVTVGTTGQTWSKTGEGNTVYSADESTLTLSGTTFSLKDAGIDLAGAKIGTNALPATKGGTGQTGYAIGDLLYATTSTALGKLAAVADGNVLRSAGGTTAPVWGKVRLSGATTDITGTLAIGNGGTGQTTAAAALAALGGTAKYATSIGNGSLTTFTVNHALNTTDITVTVKVNSTGEIVYPDVTVTDANNISVSIPTSPAPTNNQYRVTVIG